ncbi:uncharacterized protein LOC131954372 [Physella acuta]|uniref:uncharacterized protein LOC131954372 n=1 Tax=Physella acuta TaxID=109671 RepID=UPI0027DE719A|nr:uncharacterized protein LOC131954372 [Physella acuta]XP_059174101.1 uncharacterized protein LOC131954372 [Physella acuta]XP_059174193.1 uncharacterized protein LOC131954372 [Physella acuta]
MQRKGWVSLTLFLIVVATVIHIAGLVSPLWIWLVKTEYTVAVGLYYRVGCGASTDGPCTSPTFKTDLPFNYIAEYTYKTKEWEAIVWLESIAAGIAVLLCVMALVYRAGFGVWKKMSSLNLAMTITAILTWLPLGAGLILYIIRYGLVITRSPDLNSRSFPWSPLLCLIAGVIFFIVPFFIRLKCSHRNYIQHAIPTSADSKMVLNPSTKNQIMRRYFSPSPYREDRRQALQSPESVYSNDQRYLLGNGHARAITNGGFTNPSMKAIEYEVVDNQVGVSGDVQYKYTPVIETANLVTGVTLGSEVTKGEVVNRNIVYNSEVKPLNNIETTQVIERTYVTKTGSGGYGGNYSTDQAEYLRRQEEMHRQWEELQAQAAERRFREERLVGTQVVLSDRRHDGFSDINDDASVGKTIFYTGKEGVTRVLGSGLRSQSNYTAEVTRNEGHFKQNGVVQEIRTVIHPPTPPPQVYREVKVIEQEKGHLHKDFRVLADSSVDKSGVYTSHIRPATPSGDKLVLSPGYLSGDRIKYNGTYMYRPYTEEIY